MNDNITLPVIFIKPEFKVDRSVKLIFETRELTGLEIAILADSRQTEGWLLYSSKDDIKESDIPDEKPDAMLGQKTQAQRLRGVIYRLWEQNGKKGNSEDYYKKIMESLIEQVKDKLE